MYTHIYIYINFFLPFSIHLFWRVTRVLRERERDVQKSQHYELCVSNES